LSFGGAANPPDVTEGNENTVTVFYIVNNSSPTAASAQNTTFSVVYDDFRMQFDNFNVDPTPFDNCSSSGGVVTCSCLSTCGGVFDNSSGVTIGLPFILEGTPARGPFPTPEGIYSFDATLSNANIVPNPIMTSKTLNVLSPFGLNPDYELLVGSGTPSPIEIDPQNSSPIPFEFELRNIGNGMGFGIDEFISIEVADGFALSGVAMNSVVGVSPWSCSVMGGSPPFDNDWSCANGDSVGGMQPSDFARITGNMSIYDTVNNTPGAISASLFPSSDQNTSNNQASISTTIILPPPDPDVVIDMDLGPELFPGGKGSLLALEGSVISYVIEVNALDTGSGGTKSIRGAPSGPATNVVITHTIPPELTFDSITNIVGPNLVGNCSEAGGVVSCTIPSLPVTSAEDSFAINVMVGGSPGDFILPNAFVTADNDFDTNNNSANTQGFEIAGEIDLEISKEAQNLQGVAQASFEEGENFQYVLTVSNVSNADAENFDVQVTDFVPTGLTIGNFVAPSGWDCGGSNLGSNIIACSNSTSFDAFTSVDFIIPVSTLIADEYINNASVDYSTYISPLIELNLANNDSTSTINIGTETTLSVSIDTLILGNPVRSISEGATFTYAVSVTNTGSFNANFLVIEDQMPGGVTVNRISGSNGWSCTNQALIYTCNFPGSLAPGASTFVNFNVTETGSGTGLTNTVNAHATNAPEVRDTKVSEVTNVTFDVNITQNPNPIEEDQPFELIIDIINTGTEEIIGTEIVNTLPEGFSYTTQTKSSTCIVMGQDMTCTIDDPIALGATETVIIGIQAITTSDANAVYNNSITVSGTNIPSPISVQTVTNVNPAGGGSGDFNYTVSLNDSSDPNEINTPFDYIVTIENTGSAHITFLDVDVGIPSELTTNSMITNGFICSSASFGLSCNSDQSLDIAPGESLDIITVNVQSNSFIGDVLADVLVDLGTVLQRTDEETTTIIDTQVVVLNPDISVEIVSGDAIDQGAVSEFEVKIANSGPDVAEDVVLDMSISGLIDSVSVVQGSAWTCQVNSLIINCQFNEDTMSVGHQSSIFVTANTTQVVVDAENLILSATLTTSSQDSNLANNTASSQVDVSGTPLEGEIGDAIRDALGGTGNPQVDSAIDGIAGFCEIAFYTAIEGLCGDLYDAALAGETETVRTAIEQIMPNEVIGQSTSVSEIATAQFRNIGARLSQVRGGGGSGFSTAGLNARYGNGSIPIGMLAYLNQTEEETNGIDTNNDFISPWGFFINGTISMGDRDATTKELAFDFDTFGLTAGVDYRLDAKKVIGVALGYASFDSTIEDVSELNSSGVTLTGYGSFYITDNFYVDTRISYARPEFDHTRSIDFTLGSTHIDRIAAGKTDADQYSFALSAGYSFYKNAWNITPNASINYVKTTIDEFAETGAGDFNFVYLEQELDSLVWSAGIRVSKAISLKKGIISPQFDIDYNYEGLNDGKDIQARFINAPDDQMLIVVTDSPDRSYGSAGLGLVFISANGKQAYINYRTVIGLDGFSRGTFNLGARFEF
jgi:uncharacterized repeat protein (TIGR01451 family)